MTDPLPILADLASQPAAPLREQGVGGRIVAFLQHHGIGLLFHRDAGISDEDFDSERMETDL